MDDLAGRGLLWAHPRSRGENLEPFDDDTHGGGSSPLTRGKPSVPPEALIVAGLIPAHAGKTGAVPAAHTATLAHPRSRGENDGGKKRIVEHHGSSPLTRGKRVVSGRLVGLLRLIPAHAGKTSRRTRPREKWWAHPRSRGENKATDPITGDLEGSSPLTRGKLNYGNSPQDLLRLIPAHAGKTQDRRDPRRHRRAHPRSRGENAPVGTSSYRMTGSSPLTRGKLLLLGGQEQLRGLIPAHAGKTAVRRIEQNQEGAHPRSRGENNMDLTTVTRRQGSSPLTRGKHFLTCAFTAQIGQILESLELCASSESYSSPDAYATDAP